MVNEIERSDTAREQRLPRNKGDFAKGNPYRFKKGDPRINRSGRPRSFDQLRALAQEIAHEKLGDVSKVRAILAEWASSADVAKQKAFIEYAFGKVPETQKIEGLQFPQTTLLLHYDHERPERTNGQRLPSETSRSTN